MHMDKLVAMLDSHMRDTQKWKSVVGPKTEEKLMSNIMRSGPISVLPYLGGTFKVFTGEVYLVVDMNQRTCTCMTWQMSGLPCAHVCAVIRTLRHDVYDYIDPCFHVSMQDLIYSGQFQPLPTHNMPKLCDDRGYVIDCAGNSFPACQPHVRCPPERPRRLRIESQFCHKRAIHCSRCNGIGARSSKVESYNNHFILLWPLRRLPPEKLDVVRDLQFGGLLHLNCKEIRHNICTWLIAHFNVGYKCIEITSHRRYDLTAADVGLVFGLPTTGRILHIATTPSDHPFGTLNTCEERLLNLPIGEEFRRCFIYYACATLLAPTSRIDGCRNLWHTIHEDGFRNDVNWGQFVVDQLVEGIRRFKQGNNVWLHYVMKFKIPSVHVPMTAPLLSAWSDELIKERLSAEISEFGSFGHGEAFDESSPPRTHVEDDSGPTSSNGIQHQLGIMRGLIQRLDGRRKRSVHSPTTGHSGYAADEFPDADHDSPAARYNMPTHCTEQVPDTPIRHPPIIADDEVVVLDPLPLRSMTVARSYSIGRQRRVRRMAPSVLSPFISQAQTRHSAIKMDLKAAATTVFDGELDPRHVISYTTPISSVSTCNKWYYPNIYGFVGSEELVSMHDTSLTRGNLASFQGDCWIGNDVVDAFCRMLQFDDESRTKLFLSPYIADMVIRSNAKYLTHDAIVARFDPYMYAFDGSYQNVTQAKVVLLLVADKKEMVAVDLNMYSFVMPDVPCQPNDNDCGVFIMKFMDNWSNGGLSKSIDVAKMKKYRLKLLGRLLLSSHNAHRHRFMAV
ncbi:hypothetical protein CK203_107671 [Vitis vinifera]|uniref:SWIM-type domain-containing protein n=1 Tax=Vitis vinifera TaxID=29760 RepID=A0A438FG55_VITVI|nr:hypothetical protein CK203_107671 [Vitis vinifera]